MTHHGIPFQVAGQRQKAAVGLPLQSRHRAFEQRKKTLLTEYRRFGKANEIVDRRLGERNSSLTPDQKMALRFAAERRRRYKGEDPREDRPTSNFQLTGVDSILTHRGKALSEIEKLNDRPVFDEDDDETEGFGADFVQMAHFGGGESSRAGGEDGQEGEGEKKKTRKELIEEMIANSKRARYEMQMQREKVSDLTADLDEQWKAALKDNLVAQWIRTGKDDEDEVIHDHQKPKRQEQAAEKTEIQKEKTQETASSKSTSKAKKAEPLDYDRLVHEMTFEPKAAKGGDKLKKNDGNPETEEGEERAGSEAPEPEKVRPKKVPRTHITGDDDLLDFQRFKKEKEKPFVVQYDSEGRLIQDDSVQSEEPESPPAKKPKRSQGIEFLEPRIETNFNPERKKKRPVGKSETAERQKLMQQYKKEMRGTIRELRKDNEFLARQQLLEQQQQDSERRRKVKSLMKSLVSQETECRKLKKKKKL